MHTVLMIVHVFVSIFMILVILLQPGKDGGMAGMGGGTSASAFGGRGSATFLGKVTTVCAAVFMITSLSLAYLSSKSESAVLRHQPAAPASKPAPAAATGTTAAPGATAAPVSPASAPAAATPAPAAPASAPAAPAPAAPGAPAGK